MGLEMFVQSRGVGASCCCPFDGQGDIGKPCMSKNGVGFGPGGNRGVAGVNEGLGGAGVAGGSPVSMKHWKNFLLRLVKKS